MIGPRWLLLTITMRTPLPDAILSRIMGNAPPKVKEWTVKWLNIYHTPPKCFVGALTRRTTITEVSLDPDPLENGKILTLVCESDVTEGDVPASRLDDLGAGMVDGQDQVHNAFVITVIDECVAFIRLSCSI